jgi:hypothetical protein
MLLSAWLAAVLDERESIDAGLVLTTYVVGLALEQHAAAASPMHGRRTDGHSGRHSRP